MTPQDQQQQNIQSVGGESVREQDKIMLILAYCPCLLPLIPFLTVKDSEYVKWHAKQGLVLTVGGGIITTVISFLGPLALANCVLGPALLAVMILGMVKAMRGERWPIPLVSDLANKI